MGGVGWGCTEPVVSTTLVTFCGRCHNWVGIPGRPPYVIPRGSAGWNKKKRHNVLCACFILTRYHRFTLEVNLGKLDKPVDRNQWSMTPPTVNAYYTPTKNQIVFPAGLLQTPFFSLKYPRSLNFGAMGVVMGHELSHAFDDQGRGYDEKGNMRNWWNNITLQEFKQRTNCMERQYSSYHLGLQNVSGQQTLG